MKHNSALQSNHFKKTSLRFKTWFHQPIQKRIRGEKRKARAAEIYPQSTHRLKPVVRCPNRRYNGKERLGRGFSLVELAQAALGPDYARSIGIAVDPRRYSKSEESIARNVERLKTYLAKIKIYDSRNDAMCDGSKKQHVGPILPIEKQRPVIGSIPVSQIVPQEGAAAELRALRRETIKRRAKKERLGILEKTQVPAQ